MKRILAMAALLLLSMAAFALPSVDSVQAEVQRGNYAQAESMMREVVTAKPDSAKAHYIFAEILAHNRRFELASQELLLARQIDPELRFTQPDKFRAFQQLLDREQSSARRAPAGTDAAAPVARTAAPAERSGGLPGWLWGLGFAVVAVLLWRMFSARRQGMAAAAGYAGPAAGMPAAGYGPGYGNSAGYGGGYGPMGGPHGSGMLGTGIAAAGGFAAGMLVDRLLEGHHDAGSAAAAAGSGGLVPGMFDDAPAGNDAANELEQRPIDFGSGGDWSDAGSGGGGGDDGGGW